MSKILFQLSGSIAAYKSCYAISRLVQDGHEVRVACTKGALAFVGAATLEGLSGHRVFHDIYEEGRMMDHIHLARWADLAILSPASASAINRLANGIAEDAVGTLFLAWELEKKPYLIAPAMNHAMLKHPATQASLAKLKQWGVRLLAGEAGHQACGETGEGRMMEPETLVREMMREIGREAGMA